MVVQMCEIANSAAYQAGYAWEQISRSGRLAGCLYCCAVLLSGSSSDFMSQAV